MKTLTLFLLGIAYAVNAEVAVNSNTEILRTLVPLLQEHHRFVRQATTPPSTAATTSLPTSTNSSEVTPTTEPSTGFGQSACQNAFEAYEQSCFLAHGLSLETLTAQLSLSNGSNASDVYVQISEIYCSDDRCQIDYFNYFEECLGSEALAFAMQTVEALCSIHDSGMFCYEVYFSSASPNTQFSIDISPIASCFSGACTQDCREGLTDISFKYGCCVTEYFKLLDSASNGTGVYEDIWDVCGLQSPGSCTGMTTTETPATSTLPTVTMPITMEPTTTTSSTPSPFTPATIPPKSKCAKKSRKFSANRACSGGINVGELLADLSIATNVTVTSHLHSYACSKQKCFKQYTQVYRECLIDLSGARGNSSAIKLVDRTIDTFVPYVREFLCAKKDGQFCSTLFPEVLSVNFTSMLSYPSPCATAVSDTECSDCCNVLEDAAEKYGCCFQSYLSLDLLTPLREPCLGNKKWKKCGIPNPGKCEVVLKDPRRKKNN